MSGEIKTDDETLAGHARELLGFLKEARENGDHEFADLIESDMSSAVRTLWRHAGPILRSAMSKVCLQDAQPIPT